MLLLPILGAVACAVAPLVHALGEQRVTYFPSDHSTSTSGLASDQAIFSPDSSARAPADKSGGFTIASKSEGYSAPFLLDSKDDIAIHLAARTLANDIKTITGVEPRLYNDTLPRNVSEAIIIGSVGSRVVGDIEGDKGPREVVGGKWESYDIRVTKTPLKHLDAGLVITGSDRVSPFPHSHIIYHPYTVLQESKLIIHSREEQYTQSTPYLNKWESRPSITGPTSRSALTPTSPLIPL